MFLPLCVYLPARQDPSDCGPNLAYGERSGRAESAAKVEVGEFEFDLVGTS
jgi:hypothetical protein